MYEDYLVHHGVKGMKWGVRKKKEFSNGRDRRNRVKKKSRRQLALEQKYRKAGYSKEEAEYTARKRIKTERFLAAAAAISLVSIGAYKYNQKIKDNLDTTIKMDEVLQRIEYDPRGKNLHNAFYVARDKSDKTKYAGRLGILRKAQTGGNPYKMQIKTKKDIKVAGRKTAQDVFEDMYKNNKEFRSYAKTIASQNAHGKNKTSIAGFATDGNKNYKKLYENFNSNLPRRENPSVDMFYKELNKRGYGAIQDINDKKFSGFKAKNPLIVFGQQNNVVVESFNKMNMNDVYKSLAKDKAREGAKFAAKYGAAAAGAVGAAMYIDDRKDIKQYEEDQSKKKR